MSDTMKTDSGNRIDLRVSRVRIVEEGQTHSAVSDSSNKAIDHFENLIVPAPGFPSPSLCFPNTSPQEQLTALHPDSYSSASSIYDTT